MADSSRADLDRRDALLRWFGANARDLPWRRRLDAHPDAYRVWISEAMLQQTRVEAVVSFYQRFLARFPALADLAAAPEEDVIAAWSGLGYYRRARALRAAAREIMARHDGRFPSDRAAALSLPGVGPYTAGAVLSIAYGAREPVVDGNVTRVLARWFALVAPVGSGELTRELWALADALMPPEGTPGGPGAWNQALMELGATVCTPRSPRCDGCPVASFCAARAAGRPEAFPTPAPRRASVDVRLEIALAARPACNRELLFERRPPNGRMPSMWELPTREVPAPDGRLSGLWPSEHLTAVRDGPPLGEITHTITHHRIRARVRAAELAAPPAEVQRWISADFAAGLGLTGMTRKILGRPFVLEHLRSIGSAARERA